MRRTIRIPVLALLAVWIWPSPASPDSTNARCDIYPAGSDHADAMIPCTFSQRQGYITIYRSDGVAHDLSPADDIPGNFRDQEGRVVYRQSGLGDQGLIFRLPDESIFVYWSTAGLKPRDEDNPTWPFSTETYDATALLRCRAPDALEFEYCPAGILRMEDGQASIVVIGPGGEQFTINFLRDYVNAANREVVANLEGDTWMLRFASGEVWEVPRAAIEGG